jgi:hypothetical protein
MGKQRMWKFLVSVELRDGKRFEGELETDGGLICIVQAQGEDARCLAIHDNGAKTVKRLGPDNLLFPDVSCVQVTLVASGKKRAPRTLFVAAKIQGQPEVWSQFVPTPKGAVLLREQILRRPDKAPDPSCPQGVIVCDARDLPIAVVGGRPTTFAQLESLAVEIER